jgi:hypothetical protein
MLKCTLEMTPSRSPDLVSVRRAQAKRVALHSASRWVLDVDKTTFGTESERQDVDPNGLLLHGVAR